MTRRFRNNTSVVDARGRTTLPEVARSSLDLKPGDRLRYLVGDGSVRLIKMRAVTALEGMLHRPDAAHKTLEEMQGGVATGATQGAK